MDEKKNTNRKTGVNSNIPIDTSEFIRQVSFAGSKADMPEPVQADNQADSQAAMPDAPELT